VIGLTCACSAWSPLKLRLRFPAFGLPDQLGAQSREDGSGSKTDLRQQHGEDDPYDPGMQSLARGEGGSVTHIA
jgi:hypothetical protein